MEGIGPADRAPAMSTAAGGDALAAGENGATSGNANGGRGRLGAQSGALPPRVPGKQTRTLKRLTQTTPARREMRTQVCSKTLFYGLVGTQPRCKSLFYSRRERSIAVRVCLTAVPEARL